MPQNRCFLLPFLSDCHLFNVFPSRKRVQNYALFRFLQLLQTLFFKIFARKFINHCGSGMFYGMFCGRRKGNFRRILHILLRACECARVGFVRKIHTEAGKQEIFHKRERQKRGKSAGMAERNTAGACTRLAEKNASGTPKYRNG